jgi:predicted nucleic acid-binding protein
VIILDTNVLSAFVRTVPEAPVVAWLDRQPAESVWITSITLFQARLGLALLPTGRRRQALEAAFAQLLKVDLENRVLDFDSAAGSRQRRWLPNGRKPGVKWTCETRKSRVSRSQGAPRLPPETSGILGI